MPYVQRNASGVVVGVYASEQGFAAEYVADDHPDLLAFERVQAASEGAHRALAAVDAKSIRALLEWAAAQPSATQVIKDREAEAKAERAKLPR